jgi:hypothetical protein
MLVVAWATILLDCSRSHSFAAHGNPQCADFVIPSQNPAGAKICRRMAPDGSLEVELIVKLLHGVGCWESRFVCKVPMRVALVRGEFPAANASVVLAVTLPE